jgi:hypothetical protein
MPFEKKPEPKPTKYEYVFEDDGPVEVEYKYKRGYVHPGSKKKTLGELAKEAKKKVSD